MKSLRGMLLMAYILRDRQKYVSEVEVLEELLERFADSGEAKLLADVWSMLGSVLRRLGESELSVEAFKNLWSWSRIRNRSWWSAAMHCFPPMPSMALRWNICSRFMRCIGGS